MGGHKKNSKPSLIAIYLATRDPRKLLVLKGTEIGSTASGNTTITAVMHKLSKKNNNINQSMKLARYQRIPLQLSRTRNTPQHIILRHFKCRAHLS
mmetsp:Transcript_67322/g.112957  ORF Transcript_67322/g.112957 Transcript_67322/m.112957 type:complete len:96 (+) Transcript_67322:828-1115(+)